MISLALLFYLGYTANAPVWYWVCWSLAMLCQFISFGLKMYKVGATKV